MMRKLYTAIKYFIITTIAIISIFPFIWMVLGTTNTTVDILTGRLGIGKEFINNFKSLLSNDLGFINAMKNSAKISIVVTMSALFISSLSGYGFEIFKTKRSDRLFNFLLLSMMIPFASLMIPLFRMFSKLTNSPFSFLGLDTFFAVIIPSISTAFLIFFFRQSIKSFPKDIIEAARIDGLNEFEIFIKIYIPAAKNTYAAAAIITFMGSWNSYLWPLIALQTPEKRTLPLIISAMSSSYTPDYGMIMFAIVIATLPTAILFFLMQKQFIHGMLGSVK